MCVTLLQGGEGTDRRPVQGVLSDVSMVTQIGQQKRNGLVSPSHQRSYFFPLSSILLLQSRKQGEILITFDSTIHLVLSKSGVGSQRQPPYARKHDTTTHHPRDTDVCLGDEESDGSAQRASGTGARGGFALGR